MQMQLRSNLQRYDEKLIEELEKNYAKILAQYKYKNWQYFGSEVGQFNEIIYRIIEKELTGKYTPLDQKLPIFNNTVLQKWENSCLLCKDETFRIVIPRVLFSMFCLRNKRGMVHKNEISPNEMDANILLANVKWIISELVRKSQNVDFAVAQDIIAAINTKDLDIIWNFDGKIKVLGKIPAKQKILILLYVKNKMTDEELRKQLEYANPTQFNKILLDLHKTQLIDYSQHFCILSPIGIKEVEKIMNNAKMKAE